MKASAVIMRGRKRSLAPSRAASTRGLPRSYSSLGERDDQIEFLAPRPMSITRPIWVYTSFSI